MPSEHLVIINIVGDVLTMPLDALLLLQFICVPLAPQTHSHFTDEKNHLMVKINFYQHNILFITRFLLQ